MRSSTCLILMLNDIRIYKCGLFWCESSFYIPCNNRLYSYAIYTKYRYTAANEVDKTMNYLPEWLSMGVKWMGGCCGVDHEELREIGVKVMDYSKCHRVK